MRGTTRPDGAPAAPASRAGAGGGGSTLRVLLVLGLLGVAVLASALAGPWTPEFTPGGPVSVQEPQAVPPPVVTAPPEPEAEPARPDRRPEGEAPWLRPLLVTATVLAIALLVLRIVRQAARRVEDAGADDDAARSGAGTPVGAVDVPHLHVLRTGVEAAAEHLRSTARPVDAVIAAWVRLEEAAAASGVERHPAATPTEFTVAVLERTSADRSAVQTLLGLYLRARFGDERLTADDVATARR
ncbi:MAG: DUF4129 domain-containing protein, partial [Actinotalea sp.]|nr:DUF4129 domain-containing protein [Actinotalea sp.]